MRNEYIYIYIYVCSINSTFFPTPPHLLSAILMMSFFVMPEDVQVKESFAAEQAHQPHS